MLEVRGNLWTYPADWRAITTNGMVRKDGCAVMGRGCALEAKSQHPGIDRVLGRLLRDFGNHVHILKHGLLSFPVKHTWYEEADLELIARSVTELQAMTALAHSTIVIPRPGCGNGRRTWAEVKPLLEVLPDTVMVITHA